MLMLENDTSTQRIFWYAYYLWYTQFICLSYNRSQEVGRWVQVAILKWGGESKGRI